MAGVFSRISGTTAAWAVGITLIVAQFAGGEGPATQPQQLNRTDLAPAALRQAAALIEKYVQPIAEQEPTAQQKRAIESAMKLLKSEQAMKGQSAIERFVEIGPAALGELRRLAATAPAESSTGEELTADTYAAIMAAIIIRRVEAAQRQPVLEELLSLGDDAHAVLSLKLNENEAQATAAAARIEAATAALIKASADTTLDAPAVARQRKALAEAQAVEKQIQARRDLLIELRRLMAPKPPAPQPAQPPASPQEQPQPATPPANVLQIQPIAPPTGSPSPGSPPPSSPPMGPSPYSYVPQQNTWPYGSDWLSVNDEWFSTPPLTYVPPVITAVPQVSRPTPPPKR
jgi:hypothetical protein